MGNSSYSEGSRSGRIVQFSQAGFIWKTYEGEIILDGIKQTSTANGDKTSIANTWNFSLDSKAARGENTNELVKKIQNKLDSGESVRIDYWVPYIKFPCRGMTRFFVKDVV